MAMASRAQFDEYYQSYSAHMSTLLSLLNNNVIDFRFFQIEDIAAIDENDVREHGAKFLQVIPMHDARFRNEAIRYLNKTSKAIGHSTLYVSRAPGLLLVNHSQAEIIEVIHQLNSAKDKLALSVQYKTEYDDPKKFYAEENKRDKYQRHKFLHDALPGVMSEQLYRHVQFIDEPVSNVWFNWVQRPVNKKMDKVSARTYIYNQIPRPRDQFTASQWKLRLEEVLERFGEYDFFETKRLLRNMPIMTYKYSEQSKRNTKNANTPVILLNQQSEGMPKTTDLQNWDRDGRQRKPRPIIGLTKQLLIPSLNFYGVIDSRDNSG
jgi:hypothetical protein